MKFGDDCAVVQICSLAKISHDLLRLNLLAHFMRGDFGCPDALNRMQVGLTLLGFQDKWQDEQAFDTHLLRSTH